MARERERKESGDGSRRLTHTQRGQHVTRVKKKLQRRPIDYQTGTRRENGERCEEDKEMRVIHECGDANMR